MPMRSEQKVDTDLNSDNYFEKFNKSRCSLFCVDLPPQHNDRDDDGKSVDQHEQWKRVAY